MNEWRDERTCDGCGARLPVESGRCPFCGGRDRVMPVLLLFLGAGALFFVLAMAIARSAK